MDLKTFTTILGFALWSSSVNSWNLSGASLSWATFDSLRSRENPARSRSECGEIQAIMVRGSSCMRRKTGILSFSSHSSVPTAAVRVLLAALSGGFSACTFSQLALPNSGMSPRSNTCLRFPSGLRAAVGEFLEFSLRHVASAGEDAVVNECEFLLDAVAVVGS